jgi:BRCT domain type II-containing protein
VASNDNFTSSFELGTQSSLTTYLTPADKSIISTGATTGASDSSGSNTFLSQALDVAPQDWTNGYLVGVDQLYLRSSGQNAQGTIFIIMECTVETMSQSAAMGLALSQQ